MASRRRSPAHLDTPGGRCRAVAASRLPEDALVVVDSARILGQIEAMRRAFGRRVTHVHLYAPVDELRRRYGRRRGHDLPSYDEVSPTEAAIDSLIDDADVVIDTSRSTAADVTVRAASHLGLTGRDTGRLVDVIVGGQWAPRAKATSPTTSRPNMTTCSGSAARMRATRSSGTPVASTPTTSCLPARAPARRTS
jgi:hypothetical protein